MLYDTRAGRPTEHDAIHGAILRAAERHGVSVPLTRLVHGLLETRVAMGAQTSPMSKDGGMANPADIDLENYNPMDREVQQCPFDHYAALREHGPLFHHSQTGMYFASRLDVVNEILRDTETFSSQMASAARWARSDVMDQVAEIMAEGWPRADTMLTIDPPHQTRYRKLVSRAFSHGASRARRQDPRDRNELIDDFPDKGTHRLSRRLRRVVSGAGDPLRAEHVARNRREDQGLVR